MVYPHAFQILVWAKNDLFMQKFCAIRPSIDILKQAGILALMKPGLEALIRLIMETQRFYSIRPNS